MPKVAFAAIVFFAATAAFAQDLPDLAGKEIVVVTENAYPPLQFLDKDGKVVTDVTPLQINALVEDGTLHGGMLPKIASALEAAQSGAKSVHIIDGRVEHALLLEILTNPGFGTMIKSA